MNFFTIDEAADFINVSHRTIYRMLKEGKVRGFRIGGTGRWRIEKASISEFCQSTTGAGESK